MRFLVMVKATKESEAGAMPDPEVMAAMGKFNKELVEAGVMLAAEGIKPSSEGMRVRFSGDTRTVIDGPFAETKELVAGFWLWQVKSREEAIYWAKRCPSPSLGESEIELRPLWSMEELALVLTPEQMERRAKLGFAVEK